MAATRILCFMYYYFLCLVAVNQVDAGRIKDSAVYDWSCYERENYVTTKRLIDTPAEAPRIRVRRTTPYEVVNCSYDDADIYKENGFSRINNISVQFIRSDGEYFVRVEWDHPIGHKNSLPNGYWFVWLWAPHEEFFTFVCNKLSGQTTSFVINANESEYWNKDDVIEFAVYPLPTNRNFSRDGYDMSTPYDPREHYNDKHATEEKAAIKPSTSTVLTSFTSYEETTRVVAERSQNINFTEKKYFTPTLITIAGVAVFVVFVIIVLRYCYRRPFWYYQDKPRSPGYIYISYIAETTSHTEKVVDLCSWLRKHGYDVQMDIILTSSNQEDLKELGRLRWAQKQLDRAKGVIIILSASYMRLCGLDDGKMDATSLTQKEAMVYSEITQIRDDLSHTAYINSRYIPVLFDVKETELPFWIKQMVVYRWPEDKLNDRLLHRVNDEVSGENGLVWTNSRETVDDIIISN